MAVVHVTGLVAKDFLLETVTCEMNELKLNDLVCFDQNILSFYIVKEVNGYCIVVVNPTDHITDCVWYIL